MAFAVNSQQDMRNSNVVISDQAEEKRWGLRLPAAVLIGLAGAVGIWLFTPYNDFVIGTPSIAGSYLPIAGMFLVLVLVLIINPLLRRLVPGLALTKGQLVIILGMLFVACTLPSQGLLQFLPYGIANIPRQARDSRSVAETYRKAGIPASLFPDKIAYGADTPAGEYFINKLPPGGSIPWSAWARPAFTWGPFLLASWLMMMGLALIVLPQWRRNERLTFPLLAIQESLIEEPETGFFAPLFRKRSFWIAAGVVFVLHFLTGAKGYDPESIPAVPLGWDLTRLFTEEPWNNLPPRVYRGRIYFTFVAMAFFMPSRASFSICFFYLLHCAHRCIVATYLPPYHHRMRADQITGATVALTAWILWLGRRHWAAVFTSLFRRAPDPAARRDRKAMGMFLIGCAGTWTFMVWVGVQPAWALFYVGVIFMISLVVTRLVAETGMPFMRVIIPSGLTGMAPMSWLSPVTLFFLPVVSVLFSNASRANVMAMAAQAIALDPQASPRRQSRFAMALIGLLVIGLLICGAAHLYYNYHNATSVDGNFQPVNPSGIRLFSSAATNGLMSFAQGRSREAPYSRGACVALGAAVTCVLLWLCTTLPKWPLHPVGLLIGLLWYGEVTWVSLFVGLLLKTMLLRYGGPRMYRQARPALMGLIIGEVLAAVFWAIEPIVRVALDMPYRAVQVQPM